MEMLYKIICANLALVYFREEFQTQSKGADLRFVEELLVKDGHQSFTSKHTENKTQVKKNT